MPYREHPLSPSWRRAAPVSRRRLAGALLGLPLLLAACGGGMSGGGSAKGGAAAQPIRIDVNASEMKFEPKTISARAGEVTFAVKNAGAIEHNFVIEDGAGGSPGRIPNIAVGATEQLAVTLKAGTYTFICGLPGHKEAGMTGTLTVTT